MAHLTAPPPEWLNAAYMEQHLQETFQDPELQIAEIEIRPGSKEGEGYVCQILRVIINISNSEKGSYELSLICKLNPKSALGSAFSFDLHDNEVAYYTKLQHKYYEVLSNTSKPSPNFYFTDDDKGVIFLEDLKSCGFENLKKTQFLDLREAEIGMECIGAYHGASLQVLFNEPELKEGWPASIWGENLAQPLAILFGNGMKVIAKYADNFGLSKKYREAILKMEEEIENGRQKMCDAQEDEINVLAHGDLNKMNCMLHYTDGVVDDARIYDFQTVHYNGIAQDIYPFLFLNVRSDVIVNNIDHLLEVYYNKLKEVASDVPDLTLERVKENYAARAYFGFELAVITRAFVGSEVPYDFNKILSGDGIVEDGFTDDFYAKDLKLLLPYFESLGAF